MPGPAAMNHSGRPGRTEESGTPGRPGRMQKSGTPGRTEKSGAPGRPGRTDKSGKSGAGLGIVPGLRTPGARLLGKTPASAM
jgi:hypothetical protein